MNSRALLRLLETAESRIGKHHQNTIMGLSSEQDPKAATLSRRQVLMGAGAVTGGLVLPNSVDAASQTPPAGVVSGVVEVIESPTKARIRSVDGSAVDVTLAGEVTPWRHSGETRLEAFMPGDEVVVAGRQTSTVLVASLFETIFHVVDGRIVDRNATMIVTDSGSFLLGPDSLPWEHPAFVVSPLDDLAVGDQVVGLSWREPRSGALIVHRIAKLPEAA